MSMPNYRNLVTATALTSALLALAGCGKAPPALQLRSPFLCRMKSTKAPVTWR